jgi:protein PsiE
MIILTTKGTEPEFILYETAGIFILSVSAYIMTMKDKISLEKLKLKQELNSD